jgi:hypothetical protein
MAAAISIQDIIVPPKILPKELVCEGSTNWVIITWDAKTGFALLTTLFSKTKNAVRSDQSRHLLRFQFLIT